MSWFEVLTGIRETSSDQVREQIAIDAGTMTSLANGSSFQFGQLETPSLAELRDRARSCRVPIGQTTVRELVANVQHLHADEANAGSLFQVASQFNLLEMADPQITPERGVGIYERDRTQGPACAIAAGAGTIYRNYFADVNGRAGQSADNQIDCLADLGKALGNSESQLWKMTNGYAMATREGLAKLSQWLRSSNDEAIDQFRKLLRIGIQWNTQVTITNSQHCVTQAFCSALPVAYCPHDPALWDSLARIVLDATYEATFCAAVLNHHATQNNRLFLTLVGGGAFGNQTEWITDAIRRALRLHKDAGLDVAIVSYGRSDRRVQELLDSPFGNSEAADGLDRD